MATARKVALKSRRNKFVGVDDGEPRTNTDYGSVAEFTVPSHPQDQGIQRMAENLAKAWKRYRELFGTAPHGSVKQMAALIEFSPQLKEAIRLFEKQREEGMTV